MLQVEEALDAALEQPLLFSFLFVQNDRAVFPHCWFASFCVRCEWPFLAAFHDVSGQYNQKLAHISFQIIITNLQSWKRCMRRQYHCHHFHYSCCHDDHYYHSLLQSSVPLLFYLFQKGNAKIKGVQEESENYCCRCYCCCSSSCRNCFMAAFPVIDTIVLSIFTFSF